MILWFCFSLLSFPSWIKAFRKSPAPSQVYTPYNCSWHRSSLCSRLVGQQMSVSEKGKMKYWLCFSVLAVFVTASALLSQQERHTEHWQSLLPETVHETKIHKHTKKNRKHRGLKIMKSVIDFLVSGKCESCSLLLKNEYCCDTPRQMLSLQLSFSKWCSLWESLLMCGVLPVLTVPTQTWSVHTVIERKSQLCPLWSNHCSISLTWQHLMLRTV